MSMKNFLLTKQRLILFLTVILFLSFLFTSLLSYNVTKKTLTSNAINNTLPLINDNIYSKIQEDLINPINNSSLMANDEFLINWVKSGEKSPVEVVRFLARIRERYGYFSSFFISENTGKYYYYGGVLKKISTEDEHDIWYYNFINKDVEYELDVDTDEATSGTITVFINHRLEDKNGQLLGVTGIGLKMGSVAETLKSFQERCNCLIYMTDAQGLIQVHPDESMVEKVNIKDLPELADVSAEILNDRDGNNIFEVRDTTRDLVISTRYFPDFDWFLIVEQDQEQSLVAARKSLLMNIGIGLGVTSLVILLVVMMINAFHKKLEALAILDGLTGIYNRGKFQELLKRELLMAKRDQQPLSILMADVDSFKSVNDEYGHPVGDTLLTTIAQTMKSGIREIDTIGRWGGEELIIMLHNTDLDQAYVVAERIRMAVDDIQLVVGDRVVTRTLSIGVACSQFGQTGLDDILTQADFAMYKAKEKGKNRTEIATPNKTAG
jgi:diguanylate cyclase (GGDEF)-like protein